MPSRPTSRSRAWASRVHKNPIKLSRRSKLRVANEPESPPQGAVDRPRPGQIENESKKAGISSSEAENSICAPECGPITKFSKNAENSYTGPSGGPLGNVSDYAVNSNNGVVGMCSKNAENSYLGPSNGALRNVSGFAENSNNGAVGKCSKNAENSYLGPANGALRNVLGHAENSYHRPANGALRNVSDYADNSNFGPRCEPLENGSKAGTNRTLRDLTLARFARERTSRLAQIVSLRRSQRAKLSQNEPDSPSKRNAENSYHGPANGALRNVSDNAENSNYGPTNDALGNVSEYAENSNPGPSKGALRNVSENAENSDIGPRCEPLRNVFDADNSNFGPSNSPAGILSQNAELSNYGPSDGPLRDASNYAGNPNFGPNRYIAEKFSEKTAHEEIIIPNGSKYPTVADIDLSLGWERRKDPKSGKHFYVDHKMKLTHWKLPPADVRDLAYFDQIAIPKISDPAPQDLPLSNDAEEFQILTETLLDLREPSGERDFLSNAWDEQVLDRLQALTGPSVGNETIESVSETGQEKPKSKAGLFPETFRDISSNQTGVCVPIDSVTNFQKKLWSRSTCPRLYPRKWGTMRELNVLSNFPIKLL